MVAQFSTIEHNHYIGETCTKVLSQIRSSHQDGKIEEWYHYVHSIWEWFTKWDVGKIQGSFVEVSLSWPTGLTPNPVDATIGGFLIRLMRPNKALALREIDAK